MPLEAVSLGSGFPVTIVDGRLLPGSTPRTRFYNQSTAVSRGPSEAEDLAGHGSTSTFVYGCPNLTQTPSDPDHTMIFGSLLAV